MDSSMTKVSSGYKLSNLIMTHAYSVLNGIVNVASFPDRTGGAPYEQP